MGRVNMRIIVQMPDKHEALSSHPRTIKKKKKKQNKQKKPTRLVHLVFDTLRLNDANL
jgi:hypothetical protein